MTFQISGTSGLTFPDTTTQGTGGVSRSGDTMSGGLTLGGQLNLGSNGQIVFPATQNASANANTLDDYEEGTWTPQIRSANDPLAGQVITGDATYTKIGALVHIQFDIIITTLGTGSNNSAHLLGLPFTAKAGTGRAQLFIGFRSDLNTTVIHMGADINPTSTLADIYSLSSASAGIERLGPLTLFQNGTRIMASATYIAA